MRLTVIGCSGSMPGPDSPASSYLLEHEGFRVLLDLGSGAIGPLQEHITLSQVDAILLTHLHGDHCLDICPYVIFRRYFIPEPLPRVPVLGPRGTHGRLAAAYDPTSTEPLTDVFAFGALSPGVREVGPFTLQVDRVNHPVETFAMRLTAGDKTLTYSGDTGPSDSLVRLASGSDVLLCEASYPEGYLAPPDLHLTGREAGEHAAKAGVGRLLTTHFPPNVDAEAITAAAAAEFNGPTTRVRPGQTYDI